MEFQENGILTFATGKSLRICYINLITSVIYVIEMNENKLPYAMGLEELRFSLTNNEFVFQEESDATLLISDESLTERQREKRDFAWEVVRWIEKEAGNPEKLYLRKACTPLLHKGSILYGISFNSIKNYFIRYLQGGKTKVGLTPRYDKCGGRGKDRSSKETKLGRPKKYGELDGVNVDEKVKKQIKNSLNKHYNNERKNSLKVAFELMLKDHYTKKVKSGERTILVLEDIRPSYNQFLYWSKKLTNKKTEISRREGTRVYQQKYRTIIGDSTVEAQQGPGTLWQLDATKMDVYCVSTLNRNVIVGRPNLILIIDVYSKMIVGMNVSFESFNSYSGTLLALENAMTEKVTYSKKFGVDIEEKEWPVHCIPQRILADRGEMVGTQVENAIEQLGVTIQNTPPYNSSAKGVIEQAFHQLHNRIKPFVDGAVINGKGSRERGEIDYRLKSNLTNEELTQILIRCILFYNNHHVLSDYILDEKMIEEGVEKIPIHIWNHGIKYGKGRLRTLPKETIIVQLFPKSKALVTARGVRFKRILYASDYTLSNNYHERARMNGNYKVTICYDPRNCTNIYLMDENTNEVHKLTLLDQLTKYKDRTFFEIDKTIELEMQRDNEAKEMELKEKMNFFEEVEKIVSHSRKEAKDNSVPISNASKVKGIGLNHKKEKEYFREKDYDTDQKEENTKEEDEFDLYRMIQEEEWGDE